MMLYIVFLPQKVAFAFVMQHHSHYIYDILLLKSYWPAEHTLLMKPDSCPRASVDHQEPNLVCPCCLKEVVSIRIPCTIPFDLHELETHLCKRYIAQAHWMIRKKSCYIKSKPKTNGAYQYHRFTQLEPVSYPATMTKFNVLI